ncbi:hypothetical protein Golob_026406 [Gossypium lobatum]|uniref:CCHC-type domain-containing protein n=2 Tax=Gossypium lobatum TaxID=34289 RepID=A0A7J8LV16_9ROSI|nr:hypothetical protein [Gossypium lobatum]
MVRLKEDPDTISRTLRGNLRVVWNNSSTINMLNYCVKHKEIDLYVEHEIDTAIFANDDLMLTVATVEGVEVVGSQCGEGGEVEGVDGLDASIEGLKESDEGLNSSVEEDGEEGVEDESDSDLENKNVYLMKVVYFSDGDDDEELQEARKEVRELEGKTSGKTKETILDETKNESSGEQFDDEVPKEVEGDGLDDRVDREKEGNEIEYFDSDDQGSILGSDDDDNTDTCRRRKEFTILWDYADELRLKNLGSTIKMAVNRVMSESLPHFKRFYVCFEALKRGWKEGCRPILGLDGCFLKGPFKGKMLSAVGKDENNQMYQVAWDISSRKKEKAFEFAFWKIVKSTTQREWEQNKEELYKIDEDPDDYLHRYYQNETYMKACAYALQPINGSHEWGKFGIEPMLPPVEKTMPGRPKKNKRKAKNELKKVKPRQLNMAGLIMRCRTCGGEGHNRRSCLQANTIDHSLVRVQELEAKKGWYDRNLSAHKNPLQQRR